MTTQLLVMGIPMVLFVFGLWVGVPLWMVLRHPDRDPRETRSVPAYLQNRGIAPAAFPAQRKAPERDDAERRELVSASR